jgi:hypothetical protein
MLSASTRIQSKKNEVNPRPAVDYQIFSLDIDRESVKKKERKRQKDSEKKKDNKKKKVLSLKEWPWLPKVFCLMFEICVFEFSCRLAWCELFN